jgi:GT2 family glycosyltransferase
MLSFSEVRHKSVCWGNNVGLRVANGEYIALLNNDLVLENTWFHTLVHFLESHRLWCRGGRALAGTHRIRPGMSNDYYY